MPDLLMDADWMALGWYCIGCFGSFMLGMGVCYRIFKEEIDHFHA